MNIAGIAANTGAAPATAAGVADARLADNFDTFLTLLTTQLEHQDPLDPMDATQFTDQLVQFSQVEQSIASNKHLEKLLAMISTNSTADAVSYLGKKVEAEGATTSLSKGKAQWRYHLPENSANTNITVSDANGKLVYSTNGKLTAGSNDFTWDGKDRIGNTLPEGSYTIGVSAQDANEEGIMVGNFVAGTVDSVHNDASGVVLMLQNVPIPANSVTKVSNPADAPALPGA